MTIPNTRSLDPGSYYYYDCEDEDVKDEDDEDEDIWATCKTRCLDLCIGSCISQVLHICKV